MLINIAAPSLTKINKPWPPGVKTKWLSIGMTVSLLLVFILLLSPNSYAQSRLTTSWTVREPNLELVGSDIDLSVKTLGGTIEIRRTWYRGGWSINPAWDALSFERDPLDNGIRSIERGGSRFQKSGTGIYVFDRQYFIKAQPDDALSNSNVVQTGWRWYDRRGNWIDYRLDGHIIAYGDRNNNTVRFHYGDSAQPKHITQIHDHHGTPLLQYQWGGEGGKQLIRITDLRASPTRSVNYHYGANNRLSQVTDLTGGDTRYTYTSDGQISTSTDPLGRETKITYLSSVAARSGTLTGGSSARSSADSELLKRQSGDPLAAIPFIDSILGTSTGARSADPSRNPDGIGTGLVHRISSLSSNEAHNQRSQLSTAYPRKSGSNLKSDGYLSTGATSGSTTQAQRIARVGSLTDALGQTTTWEIDYDRSTRRYTILTKYPATPAQAAQPAQAATTSTGAIPAIPAIAAQPGRTVFSLYDQEGRRLQQDHGNRIVNRLNRLSVFEEETADERGLITKTLYDEARNPLRITYPDGSRISQTFDARYSRLTSRADERGTVTLYRYDERGNLITLIEGLDGSASLANPSLKPEDARLTPETRLTQYHYDTHGQLPRQIVRGQLPTALASAINADPLNTANNPKVSLLLASFPDINQTTTADALTQHQYDAYGNLTQMTDAENGLTKYNQHNSQGQATASTDPNGILSERSYDAAGRLTQLIRAKSTPQQISTTNQYDAIGNRIQSADAKGTQTTYGFDALNRLTQTRVAAGSPEQATSQTRYDSEERQLLTVDPDGVALHYHYDIDGRPLGSADAASNITQYNYGSVSGEHAGIEGLLAQVTYPTYREQYRYDLRNRQIQSTQILDANTRYTTRIDYDAAGNAIKRMDAKGTVTLTQYDRLNRAIAITDPAGSITRFGYDSRGNLASVTDSQNSTTRYIYDKLNRKTQETRPLGESTRNQYDANGNLTSTTSASGNRKVYGYDALNRRISETHYLGVNGNPHTIASRNISYGYDTNNNLLNYRDTQSSSFAASNAADPHHAVTSANADILSGSHTYDPLNRQTSTSTIYGATVSNPNPATNPAIFSKISQQSYTAAGRLKTRTDADSHSHSLSYDGAGRVNSIALNNNQSIPSTAQTIQITAYTWNEIKTIRFPNGVTQHYTHDPLQRLKQITVNPSTSAPTANNDPLLSFGYQYDEVSNPIQINRSYSLPNTQAAAQGSNPIDPIWNNGQSAQSRQTTYGYDSLYRLTSVLPVPVSTATPTEQYSYDLVHNRLSERKSNQSTSKAYAYNGNHQLQTISQLVNEVTGTTLESRTYSVDGHTQTINPAAHQNTSTGATIDQPRTYHYDASERLIEVRDSASNQTIATYRYDPFGRRVRKTVEQANTSITPQNPIAQTVGTTYYGYDSSGLIAGYTVFGYLTSSYSYQPNSTWQTNPLYKRDRIGSESNATNQYHYYHTDHLGTPQLLTNDQANVSWRAQYEAFGAATIDQSIVNATNLNSASMPANQVTINNHRFPGQHYDTETNLAQNYFRDYEASIGRYVESDPIGLRGGQNTYAYVVNHPLSFGDPRGLAPGDKWYGYGNRAFRNWFHRCWKKDGDPDADKEEMAEAYAEWLSRGSPTNDKCDGPSPPPPVPADACGDSCKENVATVVVAGGTAYIVYRCIRMIPSLFPPFWPTIPANVVVP